jgi:thioredoxin 1
MKQLGFAILIAVMGLVACSSSTEKKVEQNSNTVQSVETTLTSGGETVQLNKQKFLEQIMDYEKNPQEWIYKADKPGLVDFYADWCRPCKMTSPILDELAKEYEGKITIYKVNVDKERELASVFGVQSIPTFLFMPKEGKPTISSGIAQTPEQTKEMFRKQIEEILLKSLTTGS